MLAEAAVKPEPEASLAELVQLGADDSVFFCRWMFPKTFRQASPAFHREIWKLLDDPSARYCNLEVFRDGAKTTLFRAYAAKRIAYGISRTIMIVGKSQDHAKRSVRWLRLQVEHNHALATVFGLQKGGKWTDEELQILHGSEGHSIWVIAVGITGSTRGINFDDYRPDLILLDDVVDDENSATKEAREKMVQLVLGAIKESLSPASETPDAKMVILQTPLDFEDISQVAKKDPQFKSIRFGCWTHATENLPVEMQESIWPERYPSEVLRNEKRAALARNRLSIFARERECKLITPETCAFREEWLHFFGEGEDNPEPPLHEMWIEMAIDPVPPPSEVQVAKGFADKDFEALSVVGRWQNKYYLLESSYNRGHEPNWTVAEFFRLRARWNPRKCLVESVAYQRTLAWLLREAQKRTGRYMVIEEFVDKRKKLDRIRQSLAGVASEGALYVRRSQSEFLSQYIHYPGKNPEGDHDDVLESVAVAVASLSRGWVGDRGDVYLEMEEEEVKALSARAGRGCP